MLPVPSRVAATTLAVAVAVGVSAPAYAFKAPAPGPTHSKHHGHHHGHGHGNQATVRLERLVARTDARLALALRRTDRLAPLVAELVAANILEDRAHLATLTTLREVHAVHPEVYATSLSLLRKVARLQEEVATLPGSDACDAASAALGDALVLLVGLDASSGKAALASAKDVVHAAQVLVEAATPAEQPVS